MKRILVGFLIALTIASTSTVYANALSAEQNVNYSTPDHSFFYLPEYQCELQKTNNTIDKYIESKFSKESGNAQTRGSVYNNLSVPLHQQINGWYCGPASGKMIVDYVTNTTNTDQATMASAMKTTRSGTDALNFASGLNAMLATVNTSKRCQAVQVYYYSLWNSLVYSIDNDFPVGCNVETSYLPSYNGHSCQHYIVSTGYALWTYATTTLFYVYYNDPHDNSAYFGQYNCSLAQMTDAIYYRAGYYYRLA